MGLSWMGRPNDYGLGLGSCLSRSKLKSDEFSECNRFNASVRARQLWAYEVAASACDSISQVPHIPNNMVVEFRPTSSSRTPLHPQRPRTTPLDMFRRILDLNYSNFADFFDRVSLDLDMMPFYSDVRSLPT